MKAFIWGLLGLVKVTTHEGKLNNEAHNIEKISGFKLTIPTN